MIIFNVVEVLNLDDVITMLKKYFKIHFESLFLQKNKNQMSTKAEQYQLTLDYLFSQLPMYQRIGAAAFKKDLTNTLALCELLDNPQTKFKTIHIGGTNGKGSVSHLLAAMLQSAGLKVGLYVSPHYKDFRERIKINGKYISKQYVIDFVENHKVDFERIEPSFFEMTVALAFDYFANQKVDVAIIEVGLGGRLDSTNVISPLLSVITNISYDHMNMLGNTLVEIAGEKAGIIKLNTPIVIGERQAEVEQVFIDKAKSQDADLTFASDKLHLDSIEAGFIGFKNHFSTQKPMSLWIKTDLPNYQQNNIRTALVAIEKLNDLKVLKPINEQAIRKALEELLTLTKFIGRWQILGQNPLLIADSAHNEAGVTLAMEQLKALAYSKLHIVMGTVNDKDVTKILNLYPKKATYYFAKANIPRGLEVDFLKRQANEIGLKGRGYLSVKKALKAAKRNAEPSDLILVIGSIFVVAEVL